MFRHRLPFLAIYFLLLAHTINGQPTVFGGSITSSSNTCGNFDPRWSDPTTTTDGIINVVKFGVILTCSLPTTFTYNMDGSYEVTRFWLETQVGATANNGIKDFTVTFYDALNAGGNSLGTLSGSAALLSNTWESFPTASSITGVRSFTLEIQTSHGSGDPEFDEVGLSASLLPVDMLNFNATIKDKGVLLNWATAAEINNEGFFVERSGDGRNWELLSFNQGQGTSYVRNDYTFLDADPLLGINYYRLEQIDYNGASEYSKVTAIDFDLPSMKNQFKVYPNPSVGLLHIKIKSAVPKSVSVRINDSFGRLVWERDRMDGQIDWQEELILENVGLYVVRTQIGEEVYIERVFISGG